MKRIISVFITFLLIFSATTVSGDNTNQKISIVTVNFPEYDLARAICETQADIVMLLPPGSESHQYDPTPQDIVRIGNTNLFFYNGGESDSWAESILESFGENVPTVFRMMDCIQVLEEETSASMSFEEEETEADEHVWTSPKNMMLIAHAFTEKLCEINPENAEFFYSSLQVYLDELNKLDAAITEIVANAKRDILVFGDRFPFRYFVQDYGLHYDAAFPGCSEDTEPNVRTIISLVELIKKEQIPIILTIEFSSEKTADILCEETGAVKRTFHSCHNVTKTDFENGITYLQLMWNNVDVLREALN